MLRILLLGLLATVTVLSAPVPQQVFDYDAIPAEFKEFFPPELAEYLKSITPEEQMTLMEHTRNYRNYENDEEFMAALKKKAPALYEKAEKFGKWLVAKFEKLDPSVQALVKKIATDGFSFSQQAKAGIVPSRVEFKKLVKGYIGEYQNLSEEAKATINTEFPQLVKLAKNEKVQAVVGAFIN